MSSFRPIIQFLFPHLTYPGTLPWGAHSPLSQDGSQSEVFWKEQDSLWPGIIPSLLTHREPFCASAVSPLSQERGEWRSFNPFKQVFGSLCPFHDYCLKVFQFSSVTQSCRTLCDPMNRSMPGLPVHHQLVEFTHVHRVGDAIQPSHPLSSHSPPAPNPSQHQGLFQ